MSIDSHSAALAHGEELQLKTSRRRMAMFFALALGLTIASLFVAASGSGILITILGGAAVVLFGFVALPVFLFRALVPTVGLRLSAQHGVWIPQLGDRWIPWTGIAGIERVDPGGGDILALLLADEAIEPVLEVTPESLVEQAEARGEEPATPAVPLPANLTISLDDLYRLLSAEVEHRGGRATA